MPTRTAISSFSNRGLDDTTIYPTGSRVRCRTCACVPPDHAGLENVIKRPGYAIEYDRRSARTGAFFDAARTSGALSRRADQRHDRLRGSRRAGAFGRGQCRARNAWSRAVNPFAHQFLSGGDDRRSHFAGCHRTLSHVHIARRIPPSPSCRQCRPAPDATGDQYRPRWRSPAGPFCRPHGNARSGPYAFAGAGGDAHRGAAGRGERQCRWRAPQPFS